MLGDLNVWIGESAREVITGAFYVLGEMVIEGEWFASVLKVELCLSNTYFQQNNLRNYPQGG